MRTAPRRDDGFSLIELLVVIALLGVVTSAIATVVITTTRAERFATQVREVMDEGRVSLDTIRREVRAARRVFADSNQAAGQMHLWIDQNQDNVIQLSEQVCYATRLLEPGKWEIVRWSGVSTACTTPPADARTIARTLRNVDPSAFTPQPTDDPDPELQTRIVEVLLRLDVTTDTGPDELALRATIRLRNAT